MRVRLMLTCLCDAFFGEVGIATVRVLEHAGCRVEFDDRQTCCGQPPFNAGDWTVARRIARHTASVFGLALTPSAPSSGASPIVVPSGSCAAMLSHGYGMLFPEYPGATTRELSLFLIHDLRLERWPLVGSALGQRRKIAVHQACHGRQLGASNEITRLMRMVPGVETVAFAQSDQCCGFGGAFSATHGKVSEGIGLEKLHHVIESGADEVVSGDMGCLMHLKGLIARRSLPLRARHFVEVMAEALP